MKVKRKSNLFKNVFPSLKLFFRGSHSNLFFTLTDLEYKVIACKTPASCGIIGRKRRKKAPQSVERIMFHFRSLLKALKVIELDIILPRPSFKHMSYLSKELTQYGYKIKSITLLRKNSHNGVRGKKLRRS